VDWRAWHDDYDRPDSPLSRRLRIVQQRIAAVLDSSPPGEIRVVSVCAGQGRDLIGMLPDHPRRNDVRARLVELDPRNTEAAGQAAAAAGLGDVEVVTGDASLVGNYRDMLPADLVLLCGVFGNISEPDIKHTISTCRQMCRTGGAVIWTRHRRPPDRVPMICVWFENRGFEREWVAEPGAPFGIAVHRYRGTTEPLAGGTRMFTFISR
jgi:hypothetical protein